MDSSIAVSHPPRTAGVDPGTLPEKYGILCRFFDGLDSAIRLLKLKRSIPTFTNICPKVECLTDRRFSHGHLAQLKRILPEAIEIKRMLIFDERTCCMKADLHVSIIFNAVVLGDESESETKNLKLRRVFRTRLAEYFKTHLEDGEVPGEDLPEPFNCSNQTTQWNMIYWPIPMMQQSLTSCGEVLKVEGRPQPSDHTNSNSKMVVEMLTDAVDDQLPVVASHLSRSFRKSFSGKTFSKAQEVEKCSKVSLRSSIFQVAELCAGKSVDSDKTTSAPTQTPTKPLAKPAISEPSPKLFLPATPIKEINPLKTEDKFPTDSGCNPSTPSKLASTPARLMIATPILQPEKRCYMSPAEVSSGSSDKLFRRTPRTRSLKFEEEKIVDDTHKMGGNPVDTDDGGVMPILSESLLHSIREKERIATEEQNLAISQATRRQQMIACLPNLFDMIYCLFQSVKRSVITKEELMHKIIAGHSDIADREEVEEQLKLLLELAPEWISEKMSPAGDLLVCINNMSSPESIRMRLHEAK